MNICRTHGQVAGLAIYLKYNLSAQRVEEKEMKKLTLMKRFMGNFVGKNFHLVIKDKDGAFKVHTIEIMQKTDDSCPVKDIVIGDYFLHLLGTNPQGAEASIVCNWTDELLKNLMANYKDAKDANFSEITMFRNPQSEDANQWFLSWGDTEGGGGENKDGQSKNPIPYIS